MVAICQGQQTKNGMLAECIEKYQDVYVRARNQFAKIYEVCSQFL